MDLGKAKRQAFYRGFWSGLAAPVDLFSQVDLPEARAARTRVKSPLLGAAEALRSDWVKIGKDMDNAIKTYDRSIRN
ncbi:MAG: hypothetical protein FWD77_01490 [Betaproteobacteria bacterium]|nr:hypothetical protein [Betaproteobacteria bacterium]